MASQTDNHETTDQSSPASHSASRNVSVTQDAETPAREVAQEVQTAKAKKTYVPQVFVQAERTGKPAGDIEAWEYLAKWVSWQLDSTTDWTNESLMVEGTCNELVARFWKHIEGREGKDRWTLEEKCPQGTVITVTRQWYKKEIERDGRKHEWRGDVYAATVPFVWPKS